MIVIEAAPRKTLPAASALGKRDLNRFLAEATAALGLAGEVSVLLTGDEQLRAMNLQFRGVDKPTDVHGLLHLAGYDHERDRGQMRRRETLLRKQFALPSGLVERTLAQRTRPASPRRGPRGGKP
jgi:probable rRNA maturation factor